MVTNLSDKIGPPRLVKKSSKSRGINDLKKASFFWQKEEILWLILQNQL